VEDKTIPHWLLKHLGIRIPYWYYNIVEIINPLSMSAVNKYLSECGFGNMPSVVLPDWVGTENIRADVFNRYVLKDGSEPMSYYFYGEKGVGKTTLLTGIARIVTKYLDVVPRYITMVDLVHLVRDKRSDELEKLQKHYFLFIDNIGFEGYTEIRESAIHNFIAYRYNNKLPFFLAGNVDIQKRKSENIIYNQLSDYMLDKTAFTIKSFTGNSRRIKEK
jgi:hypothetical protein